MNALFKRLHLAFQPGFCSSVENKLHFPPTFSCEDRAVFGKAYASAKLELAAAVIGCLLLYKYLALVFLPM
jgi:hypothetical protein